MSTETTTAPRIVTNARLLLPAIDRVLHAAATDKARLSLAGVYFETRPNRLRLVASDNYRIAWADLTAGTDTDSGEHDAIYAGDGTILPPFILRRDDVITLRKALVPEAKAYMSPVTLDADGMMIAVTVGRSTFRFLPADGTFPNYEQIIPVMDPTFTVTFDARQLADLVKIADGAHRITLRFTGPLAPVRIDPTDIYDVGKYGAVLMPAKAT